MSFSAGERKEHGKIDCVPSCSLCQLTVSVGRLLEENSLEPFREEAFALKSAP